VILLNSATAQVTVVQLMHIKQMEQHAEALLTQNAIIQIHVLQEYVFKIMNHKEVLAEIILITTAPTRIRAVQAYA
jgi:hypothetical protein